LSGAATKVYDASIAAPAGSLVLSGAGAIDGDAVILSAAGATYDTRNVSAGKAVTANGISVTASNGAATVYGYQLSSSTASANIGEITPATLTYSANAAGRERGDPNPAFSGVVTGFVGGETLATATTGTLAFNSPANQATLEGQYAISGGGLIANNGNYVFVQAPPNASALTVTAPVNFSWVATTGGAWESGTNWNKGFAPVNGAVVTIPDLPGSATITYSGGTTNVKTVNSFEGLTIAAGTLNLGAGPADVSTFRAGAPLTLSGGTLGGLGTLNVLSSLNLNGGMLTGGLTIAANVDNASGTVMPGSSPGALTISGNYVQGPGGTLLVEIGGTAPASQYDQLVVNGNATLGGTLQVTLVNGFVPLGGETFTVVRASGSVSGAFAGTSYPASPPFSAAYLPSSVLISAAPLLPPGAIESTSQILVALTDQNQNTLVASQVTGVPVEVQDSQQQELLQALQRKPMCNASSSGGGGGSGSAGPVGRGGFRCYTRGCF
jgi:hypothetical protein